MGLELIKAQAILKFIYYSKTFNALVDSVLSGGVNHIDTGLNYNFMQTERAISAAI